MAHLGCGINNRDDGASGCVPRIPTNYWRWVRDSNPRERNTRTVLKTAAFDHSANPPRSNTYVSCPDVKNQISSLSAVSACARGWCGVRQTSDLSVGLFGLVLSVIFIYEIGSNKISLQRGRHRCSAQNFCPQLTRLKKNLQL